MDVIPEHEETQERAPRRRRVERGSKTSTMDQNFIFTESFGARDQSDNVNQVLKFTYLEIMDTTIAEFLRRFSQFNSCLMTSLSALIPASSEFLKAETIKPLCELVNTTDNKVDEDQLQREAAVLNNMIESTVPDGPENAAVLKNLHNFFK